jgi:hypothetical protein
MQMTLKFKKPEIIPQRLKAMLYGEMGTGKSTCACQFPKTAFIDTEDTTSKKRYAEMIINNGGAVLATGEFDEILEQVKALMTKEHDFRTLVIDSSTIPYDNLVIECERTYGNEFGRHIVAANKKMKQLVSLLLKIDMNVVITAQAKKEYGANMSVIGQTYSGYNRLGYMFDLVFETQVRGDKFYAITRKSRLDEFPMNESFIFNYEEIIKRYDGGILEKAVVLETLATEEQVKEMMRLINLLKIPEDVQEKIKDKANAETFEEMNTVLIQKAIDYYKKQINGDEK